MSYVWCILMAAGLTGLVFAAAAYFLRPRRRTPKFVRLVQIKRSFHVQRERLEAKFVQLAAARNKPDAERWAECSFADDVSYVRNRTTGELSAFVAVTIEDPDRLRSNTPDAVGNLQAGTAVFRFDRDHWVTDGHAILNLSPNEAVLYYHGDLELVGEEVAHR